ncbi:MAG: hypothetical protein PGN25_05850 [Methylorubrum populi]
MVLRLTYFETPPMKPADADLGVTIDFAKGVANPTRVFHALVTVLEGFEALDRLLIGALDPEIQPLMVLEDVEAASITAWTRSKLRQLDDEILKSGDWKKGAGAALVKAKYRTLEYLDARADQQEAKRLVQLRDDLQRIVGEIDVRHLPRPATIELEALVKPLDQIQDAKRELGPQDRLLLKSDEETYEANISERKKPSDYLVEAEGVTSEGEMSMVLLVRRPDLLGDTKWEFKHGKDTILAAIEDKAWIERFRSGQFVLSSGFALECLVKYVYKYDKAGDLVSVSHVIKEVRGERSPTHGPGVPFSL